MITEGRVSIPGRLAAGGITPFVRDLHGPCNVPPGCEGRVYFDHYDPGPPTGSLSYPGEGQVVFGLDTVRASFDDDGGVQRVDFFIDRGAGKVGFLGTDANAADGFAYAWNPKELDATGVRLWSDGAYRLFAVGWDYKQNRAETERPLSYLHASEAGFHDARPSLAVPGGTLNLATGDLTVSGGDLSLPTVIGPLAVSRSYNSRNPVDANRLGSGWAPSADVEVDVIFRRLIDHAADVAYPSGTVELVEDDGTQHFYLGDGKNTYVSYFEDSSNLAKNGDGTWTLGLIDGSRYDFRSDGQPAQITPPSSGDGKSFTYNYDLSGLLTSIAEPTGRSVSLEYLNDHLYRLHDVNTARAWTYEYTGSDLTAVADPQGRILRYGYDAAHRMNSMTDAGGGLTYYDYDGSGRVYRIRQPFNGRDFTTTVDYADPLAPKVTGPRGNLVGCDAACRSYYTTTQTMDGAHRLVRVDKKLLSGATVSATTGWDEPEGLAGAKRARNLKTSQSDFLGNVTRNVYDEMGNLVSSTDPASNVGRNNYDEGYSGLVGAYYPNKTLTPSAGYPLRRLDATVDFNWGSCATQGTCSPDPSIGVDNFSARWTGYVEVPTTGSYTFEVIGDDGVRLSIDGRMVIDDWVDGAATRNSQPLSLNAGLHQIELQYYEATGGAAMRLRWAGPGIALQAIPATRLRPGLGLQTSSLEPGGQRHTKTYDDPFRRHLLTETQTNVDVDGVSTTAKTAYDYSDPAGGALDAYGRLRRKTLPNGNVAGLHDPAHATVYDYYAPGAVATDPCTGASADQGGLLRSKTFGNAGAIAALSFVYDERGNPLASTDGTGTTCQGYDAANRLVSAKAPDRTTATTYASDANSNRTQVSDPVAGTSIYAYDGFNRITTATDVFGGTSTSYTYDAFATTTEVTTRSDAAGVVQYTKDQLGRTTAIQSTPTGRGAEQYGFTYDVNDALDVTTYPNGATADRDYDALSRLTNLRNHTASGAAIADYTDQYDTNSKKIVEDSPQGQWRYRYDSMGRLEQVHDPVGFVRRYRYDRNTNRLATDTGVGLHWSRGTTALDATASSPVAMVDRDNGSARVDLPFSFPFYGQNLTSVFVSANGYFTTTANSSPQPPLDATRGVFPFAKDLKLGTGGIFTKAESAVNPTRFFIRWKLQAPSASGIDVANYDDFGVWLYPDGRMSFVYGQMADPAGARIGYSNGDGTNYTTIAGLDQTTVPAFAPSVELVRHLALGAGPYTYDARDRLSPDANHTYDPAGNSTRVDGATYGYDGRRMLTSTSVGLRSSSFSYDGEGRQTTSVLDGTTRRLRYGAPGDSGPRFETDGAGGITRATVVGPAGLLASETPAATSYAMLNPRGDVVADMDATGAVTASLQSYDEFGVPTAAATTAEHGFLGSFQKRTDPASGIVLMGVRGYDPRLGRFLQVDPVEGGCSNDYAYVFGDPINQLDLDGRAARCASWISGPASFLSVTGWVKAGYYFAWKRDVRKGAENLGIASLSRNIGRTLTVIGKQPGKVAIGAAATAATVVGTLVDLYCSAPSQKKMILEPGRSGQPPPQQWVMA